MQREVANLVLFSIVIGIFCLVIVGVFFGRKSVIKRNRERQEWGMRNDLEMIDPIDPNIGPFGKISTEAGRSLLAENASIDTFRHPSGIARNILRGMYGSHEVTVFDYQYTVSTGKSSTTYYFGVVLAALKANIPEFEIRSTRFWDKVTAFFGKHDIEVGSLEFDHDYFLQCADEAFMKSLMDVDTMDLVRTHDRQAWYSRSGDRLIAIRYGNLKGEEYDSLLSGAVGMAARVEHALNRA